MYTTSHSNFSLLPEGLLRIYPLPDWSKLKHIADDILKRNQNEKQAPCRAGTIVRKREIACYKQFLLFSQCFPQCVVTG